MNSQNFTLLLLGWDDMPQQSGAPQPAPLELARSLSPQATLSVILPHLPTSGNKEVPDAHVTGIADLPLADLESAAGGQINYPAGQWEAPASPYVGATHDAEESSSTVATGGLQNQDAFALEATEPSVEEAQDLGFDSSASTDAAQEAEPTATFVPFALSNDRATLAEALGALRTPPVDSSDLNFQVIQYARFATRLALAEQFAVIYAMDWPVWLAALEIRQATGRPLVLHVHSLAVDRDTPADRGWGLELERLALRRADLVLADSEAVAQRLIAEYDLSTEQVRVVAAFDDEALLAAVRPLGLAS
ncbi:glycosyltransferase family 4 protein [Hymenobacter sp. GOD-10R]|uniref:glycosyltransferase family 4 protein n=1 Tax=Hymenobacter sp. GOD-10R TaxID=3093922 RepID=UPI002D778845|nr:glycosyltransferase family 4 protein [Hymenobacter sp. GOD-10R]WRQ29932.1 glycosyltransferase family 4 protein [Hymenobacter sp. GOD-10R]